MEQQWITDRLPTRADGDQDGEVRLRSRPGSSEYNFAHWSYVGPGAPWQHTSYWKPPTEPDPTEPLLTFRQRVTALEQRVAELEAQIARVPEAIATAFDLMRAQP
jgi:uncharacterized protein YceH (UPF0502 family)